ncbi:MAG: L-serine ammonia-lyase, partial [Phaeodactylibacter sp.]|nr:L-serine ammonia-lyase [Phaeodactylibacter sp.]
FDIFKIGIGPSSSHTLGPWKAANSFVFELDDRPLKSIIVHLYGSLSKTGVGHGTDLAAMLGLMGYRPETIPVDQVQPLYEAVHQTCRLQLETQNIYFDPAFNIVYHPNSLPFHPNGLRFEAIYEDGAITEETYFSVGGGFVVQENDVPKAEDLRAFPFPIDTEAELLSYHRITGLPIHEIIAQNEASIRPPEATRAGLLRIWQTMLECIYKGAHTHGVLPGGLDVQRRAAAINHRLLKGQAYSDIEEWIELIRRSGQDFTNINKWVSCFALAVNEENASFGRVVTAPTNGAAGVIPAVLMYYMCFVEHASEDDIIRFLLTAGEVGSLFKKGATISAAAGGCQAEIGVSSAMAAAALTERMGGTAKQSLIAAEIAMEHNLGLTCDPIGGLVQVPCIERNAMGAVKAINAARMALRGDGTHHVSLDKVIATMRQTGADMMTKYKETSRGGLA